MDITQKKRTYDLEERTLRFARDARAFVSKLPRSVSNTEDGKQLVRSSGSVGANYIEANEALGSKDFLMRIRIARKEAKESRYWLDLVNTGQSESLEDERKRLYQEAIELMMILSSIMRKSS